MSSFSISGFKQHIETPRADKGKSHRYPPKRTRWDCQGQDNANLAFNDSTAKKKIGMSMTQREFKNPVEIREYWKQAKRKQRAKGKQELS